MYNTSGAGGQHQPHQASSYDSNNNQQHRASDMSAYEDDNNNNNLNARYSDYNNPSSGNSGQDSRRDSFIDPASAASPQMTEDLRKYHSQGGAYTNLGIEPSSPIMGHHHPQHHQQTAGSSSRNNQANDDGDGDSNGDSSSNGSTKVDSRSPSAYRVRGNGNPAGQGYGMGGGSQGHGSEVCRLFILLFPLSSSVNIIPPRALASSRDVLKLAARASRLTLQARTCLLASFDLIAIS